MRARIILIGTAINLYLLRVDTSRTEVEESQLARNILAMIAADIRATSVYQTQDISAIAQLAAATALEEVPAAQRRTASKKRAAKKGGAASAKKAKAKKAPAKKSATKKRATKKAPAKKATAKKPKAKAKAKR